MMQLHIVHQFAIRDRGTRLEAEDLHAEGERLMVALLDLEAVNPGVTDAATSSDAERGCVTAELLVTAENPVQALDHFLTIVRTAIHAIGGSTPGWPAIEERISYSSGRVQLEQLQDAA